MKVGLDALVAEIDRSLDWNLLEWDPKFGALSRSQRMHLILANLVREDVARTDKLDGGILVRWQPSRRLESYFGVTRHGIPDEFENVDASPAISAIADEFYKVLQANGDGVETHTVFVISCFTFYRLGMVKYLGKDDGLCQFSKSPDFDIMSEELDNCTRIEEVLDQNGRTVKFIGKCDPTLDGLLIKSLLN